MLRNILAVLMGLALLVVAMETRGNESAENAENVLAEVIFSELEESGRFPDPVELHTVWIERLEKELGPEHPEVLIALSRAGRFFYEREVYRESLVFLEREVELSEEVLGSESPETLTAMHYLALVVGGLGDNARALEIQEKVLETRARLLGPEHPNTLSTKSNLAMTLSALGDLTEARQLEEEVLEASVRILGAEHPDTLTTKSNLVTTLLGLGDLSGAHQLGVEVLEARNRVLGSEHPHTLKTKTNLAGTLLGLGNLAGAKQHFKEVVETSSRALGSEHLVTLRAKASLAVTLRLLGDLSGARRLYEEVLETFDRIHGPEHLDTLTTKVNLARTLRALGDPSRARQIYEEVIKVFSRLLGPEHPSTLKTKGNLAATLRDLGELSSAKRDYEEILTELDRLQGSEHPDTLTTRAKLAGCLRDLGDFSQARRLYEEVLEARSRILGSEHFSTLTAKANLAASLRDLGDFSGAKQHQEEVSQIFGRTLGTEHPGTLTAKENLASTLRMIGDLSGARQLQEEVLETRRSVLGLGHPDTLLAMENLAASLRAIGDLSLAQQLQEEVLKARIYHLGSEHPHTLTAKGNLATALRDLGDPSGAHQLKAEVLEARIRILGSEHPGTLTAKASLAAVMKDLGDFAGARQLQWEVLGVRIRTLGSEHPDTSALVHSLADTYRAEGEFKASSQLLEQLILQRRASLGEDYQPSTIEEANSFFLLGANLRDLGLQEPEKVGYFEQAFRSFSTGLSALEAQTLRADFSEEVRNQYKARYSVAYRRTLAVALLRNRPDDAFHVLERYRTQSLLDLLRWGRSDTGQKIPEMYREELATNGARYDYLTRELKRTHPDIDPSVLSEQAQLRRRREVIQGRILEERREAQGIPKPLGTEELREYLDPGTLLLAYSIGEESNHLFVLDRKGPITAHSIEVEPSALQIQVERLFSIDKKPVDPTKDVKETSIESREGLSRWLYEKLLSPAEERIAKAERLLILPDGPLHYLNFAALTRTAPDDPRGWQFLVERKPIHTVQSGTVYAELQSRRPAGSAVADERMQWVGFGDPVYPANTRAGAPPTMLKKDRALLPLRSTVQRGKWDGLKELPNSEREILEIARLFPEGQAVVHIGRQATEDRARDLLSQARIAHFAAHGVADPEEPMDSFLALSLLGSESQEHNGLLQAWEISDHLQLDADLVVLSACNTAVGPERRGEGLISLSRAFQIAGARSVLASLWLVDDQSTAELMIRFYRHLLAGQSKDEALRSAQLELIRGSIEVESSDGEVVELDFSSPHHWAAFQLIGDWQ